MTTFRTHPAAPEQQAHAIYFTLPSGAVMSVAVDSRGRLLVEVVGQRTVAVVPVNSGSVAIAAT